MINEELSAEIDDPRLSKRWFRVGCRVYHAYVPVLAVVGGFLFVLGWIGWELFRRIVLGQPRRAGAPVELGQFTFADFFILAIIVLLVCYGFYRLIGYWFPRQACYPELKKTWLFPEGTHRLLKWAWGRTNSESAHRPFYIPQRRKKRKRSGP